ncbi:MAG TPA: XrtA/PEP-CTERM system histidine kinase PrsK [Verrucomicrobiae bacterium]|nr:XrtA/PEP-CTERM system histidine kinase PrsK [Verrucomicrobiae bacterium]
MDLNSFLSGSAVLFCVILAVTALFRSRQRTASWFFATGMLIFGVETLLQGISQAAVSPEAISFWQGLIFMVRSLLPGVWFCFSVTYSRGNCHSFLKKWGILIIAGSLLPVALAFLVRGGLLRVVPYSDTDPTLWLYFSISGKLLNGFLLLGAVLILMNLERTLRSAVGTARWRIKFLLLGLGIIFGVRIYTRSQALLFSGSALALGSIETGALLLGCLLIGTGFIRRGFGEIDVYPSRAVLHTSLTVLLVGGYLLIVGLLAQIVARLGGAGSFQLQAFLLLLGVVLLGIFLLSEKVRQRLQTFVSRNFKRPQHDSRQVWTRFTEGMAGPRDASSLCAAVAKLLSETFNALSVSIWLPHPQDGRLSLAASTTGTGELAGSEPDSRASVAPTVEDLQRPLRPFDLDVHKDRWAESLRNVSRGKFQHGGHRIGVPLRTGDRLLGLAILADRVNALPYSVEELDLLECIGGQVGANLLNLQLATEMASGKELEAFQTISAFFVHDLKNAASTLGLMLKNLPVHFENPAFREDALRGISSTVQRINQLIGRAGSLSHTMELRRVEVDLTAMLGDAIQELRNESAVEWEENLAVMPKLMADREKLQSVIVNLLLNAIEAVEGQGAIKVATSSDDGWACFQVADNGCGMSPEFLHKSLFRPFRTTKKKGLGIGMFQSKMIVEAHRGRIVAESKPGVGTTFRVSLPLQP